MSERFQDGSGHLVSIREIVESVALVQGTGLQASYRALPAPGQTSARE